MNVRRARLLAAMLLAAYALCFGAPPASAHERCQLLDDDVYNGPCFVLRPSAGPVSTRVHFRVTVAAVHQEAVIGDWRRHPFLRMSKRIAETDNTRCQFIIGGQPSHWHIVRLEPYDPDAAVNPKAIVGWMTIGSTGNCEGHKRHAAKPGRYLLSTSWHHGAFARFRVTAGELPTTGSSSGADTAAVGALLVLVGSGVLWGSKRQSRSAATDHRDAHPEEGRGHSG